jgi:large subunit ribosomal protein L6
MSRIGNSPIEMPSGVDVNINGCEITIKGQKGSLTRNISSVVKLVRKDNVLLVEYDESDKTANMMAGTTRANINNMVVGVSTGFSRKLQLIGVGYRAKMQGKVLNLTLGFSHPVNHTVPEGIAIETPSQTEIVVSGTDKQQVGQVSAEIRAYRPPEPYKGKGVRYADEHVVRKEAKKK